MVDVDFFPPSSCFLLRLWREWMDNLWRVLLMKINLSVFLFSASRVESSIICRHSTHSSLSPTRQCRRTKRKKKKKPLWIAFHFVRSFCRFLMLIFYNWKNKSWWWRMFYIKKKIQARCFLRWSPVNALSRYRHADPNPINSFRYPARFAEYAISVLREIQCSFRKGPETQDEKISIIIHNIETYVRENLKIGRMCGLARWGYQNSKHDPVIRAQWVGNFS